MMQGLKWHIFYLKCGSLSGLTFLQSSLAFRVGAGLQSVGTGLGC